jgi:hypothetical protein
MSNYIDTISELKNESSNTEIKNCTQKWIFLLTNLILVRGYLLVVTVRYVHTVHFETAGRPGWSRERSSRGRILGRNWDKSLKSFPQCCGSMTFWCGSGSGDSCLWLMDPDPDSDPDQDPGSGSCYFRHWPSRFQQKTNFLTQFFLLITFWR